MDAGLCEFNYTPRTHDGIDVTLAIPVGERFAASLRPARRPPHRLAATATGPAR